MKIKKIIFCGLLAVIFALAFITCNNNDPDPVEPRSVKYISMDSDGNFYTLEITENTGRSARYIAQIGDSFIFTVEKVENGVYSVALTYSGTVESVQSGGTENKISVKVNGEPLTISVSDAGMTGISGKIVNAEGETVVETPTTLTIITHPDELRWSISADDTSTATLNYSVDSEGVVTVIMGGTPNASSEGWKLLLGYEYTAEANTAYAYAFEAWSPSETGISFEYAKESSVDNIWLGRGIELTTKRQKFRIIGQPVPSGGDLSLRFQFGSKTGTFYIKILSIEPYTPKLEYELIDDPTSVNHNTYRLVSGAGISGDVDIPEIYNGKAVTEIGYQAFRHCRGLTSITIPNSVKEIGGAVFANCPNLTVITVAVDNPNYSSENGILYNKVKTAIIAYPSASSITIPDSVTTINQDAFFQCINLESVIIPNSVTTIGEAAFYACDNLTSVTFATGSQLESIGTRAFKNCRCITEITIPDSVTYIGFMAFENWNSSQTINIEGHANRQSTITAEWNDNWDTFVGDLGGSGGVTVNYQGQ